ncbi:MAG: glycosyltransferase family 2 protein [bacterium]
MELSVVVPTYNQAVLLRHSMRSVVDQTLNPAMYEIIVVDDGSTDHTGEVLEEFRSRVTPIRLKVNRGRSAARNAGVAAAGAPRLVFIDSDVVVRPDFLHWHLDTHRKHGKGIVCRGPVVLLYNMDDDAMARRSIRAVWSPAFLDTANASLEKSALLQAGGFDESFPGYGWEDFELGLRLKRAGIRRVFCPEATAFHVHPEVGEETLEALLRKEQERARSAVHFLKKHPVTETRLLVQATPLHRALYWMLSGGGALTPSTALNIARRFQRWGLRSVAHVILRMALNWRYAEFLQTELTRSRA